MATSSVPESESDSSCVGSDYAEIIVLRHGETAWNADGRIQGHLDVELNDAGRQQAAVVGDRLSKEPKISVVYSSDLARAYETAQIIAARCGGIKGGGESRDQLHQRCTSSVQRIGNKHKGERVVLVSHGGFIRTLYKQASPDGRSVAKVLNTSVNIIHVYDDGKWTIKSWGDVSHLNPTGYLQSGFGGDEKSG